MPSVVNAQESLIVQFFRNALVVMLNLDPSQCDIGSVETFDPLWLGRPFYLIVPGAALPDGGGRGAQDGGALIRAMPVTVIYYDQLNLDQYGMSSETLIQLQNGTLPQFDAIRQVFAYTFFGNADGSDCLLIEPVVIQSESETTWADVEKGAYKRKFVFKTVYGGILPSGVTLTRPMVSNPVG